MDVTIQRILLVSREVRNWILSIITKRISPISREVRNLDIKKSCTENVTGTQEYEKPGYYKLLYRGFDGNPRRSGNYKILRGYKWNPGRSELDVTVNEPIYIT